MPAWAFWMGVFYLPLGALAVLWFLLRAWRTKAPVRRILHMTSALGSLYPLGMGFKTTLLGPEFLRFHLSDIGFPVCLGLVLARFYIDRDLRSRPAHGQQDDAALFWLMCRQLMLRRHMLLMTLVLSYAYEAFTGIFYAMHKDMHVLWVGSFDWMDILMYTLGVGAAYGLLVIASRRAEGYVAAARAERDRRIKAAKRPSVTAPRPGNRPRKKNRRR